MTYYAIPATGYTPFQYTSSPASSFSPEDAYNYYVPKYKDQIPQQPAVNRSSSKRDSRRDSYSTPQKPAPYQYSSTNYYGYTTPSPYVHHNVGYNYVRNPEGTKSKSRSYSMSNNIPTTKPNINAHKRNASLRTPPQRVVVDEYNQPQYTYVKPGAQEYQRPKPAKVDPHYTKPPVYRDSYDAQPTKSRARRPSQSKKATPVTPQKSARPAPAAAAKSPPVATSADATRCKIPTGYSLKNWDPTEAPVLLLGSVFDANSLGKWIYDWTVYRHGPTTPMSEIAGDLWLLLIKLAGKIRRAEECMPRIRALDNQEMVEEFLASGDRIWRRMKKLLKVCEEYMWKVAQRDGAAVRMGRNSGCEFVDSMFGRDRLLEETEKLMTSIRLWNMRFDANCEEILRRPGMA